MYEIKENIEIAIFIITLFLLKAYDCCSIIKFFLDVSDSRA